MAYMEFPLDSGGKVILEMQEGPGALPVSALQDHVEEALASFEASLRSIQEIVARIGAKLRDAVPEKPAEVEVTFGIKAAAEMKALVVAKAGGEANFTVRMKWKNPPAGA
jgi:hypothetical protein